LRAFGRVWSGNEGRWRLVSVGAGLEEDRGYRRLVTKGGRERGCCGLCYSGAPQAFLKMLAQTAEADF
jgi:hypothetical protein